MPTALGQRHIDEFARVATRYCDLIDRRALHSVEKLFHELNLVLPELLFRVSVLPHAEPDSDDLLPDLEGWNELYHSLEEILGRQNLYWQVFDPTHDAHEPIVHSLADDLSDVYFDLKRGLLIEQNLRSYTLSDVAWHWKDGFHSHWGHHAIDAYRVVHIVVSRGCWKWETQA